MGNIDAVLAIVSVFFFGLTVFSFIRKEIIKVNEKANIRVLQDRLEILQQGLGSLFHSADDIVQIPKERDDVTVADLQNYARLLRDNIYNQANLINKSKVQLDRWKFGKMIPTEMADIVRHSKHSDTPNDIRDRDQ